MATEDISRSPYYPARRYAGVSLDQGAIITDAYEKEKDIITHEERRLSRVDIIGSSGSPDEGMRVGMTHDPATPNDMLNAMLNNPNDGIEFSIHDGIFYLGGIRYELNEPVKFKAQPDWLQMEFIDVPNAQRVDVVYLEAWQQQVSAVEDREINDPAIMAGGTNRRRSMFRVRLHQGVNSLDCPEAWGIVSNAIENQNGGEMVNDHALVSASGLTVDFEEDGVITDLCSLSDNNVVNGLCTPSTVDGYLGDVDTIRVQMVGRTHMTWGFDNAAPLYRAELHDDNTTITLITEPSDICHYPRAGQVIEIIPWAAVLDNGEKLAEELELQDNHFTRINADYDPDTGQLTITDAIPANFGEAWTNREDSADIEVSPFGPPPHIPQYYFVRIWNRGTDTASDPLIQVNNNPIVLGNTGVNVTIDDTDLVKSDHWIISLRASQREHPIAWEYEVGRAPEGYQLFYAPLALIHWFPNNAQTLEPLIIDCRNRFRPLIEQKYCCSYTVGDGMHTHGDFDSIQEAIDRLPPTGGEVCILPGFYQEHVTIRSRNNISVVGCGDRSIVTHTHNGAIFSIENSNDITLKSIAMVSHRENTCVRIPTGHGLSRNIILDNLDLTAFQCSDIRIQDGNFIEIINCQIRNENVSNQCACIYTGASDVILRNNQITVKDLTAATDLYAAQGGVHLAGGSQRVQIRGNLINGGNFHGVTLGSVIRHDVPEDGTPGGGGGGGGQDPDPCAHVLPGGVIIVVSEFGPNNQPNITAGPPLIDIEIKDNRIFNMGMSGVGVIGYFDLDQYAEVITVEGLVIKRNLMNNCLHRNLETINPTLIDDSAYGVIGLADVENLVIIDNTIEDNALNHAEPVCGIFALHTEGAEIGQNRIARNGMAYQDANEFGLASSTGIRGGIVIQNAVTPTYLMEYLELTLSLSYKTGANEYSFDLSEIYSGLRQNGVPAVKIYDNIVVQPIGPALKIEGVGPMVVQDNTLVSQGVVAQPGGGSVSDMSIASISDYTPETVSILNLGINDEFYIQTLIYALLDIFSDDDDPEEPANEVVIGKTLTNGNVMFTGNQCHLDFRHMAEVALGFSIGIASLDDVHFADNQCDASLGLPVEPYNVLFDYTAGGFGISLSFAPGNTLLSNIVILAASLRANDNRFKEGLYNCYLSGALLGFYMSMVSSNQATHCLLNVETSNNHVRTANNQIVAEFEMGKNICCQIEKSLSLESQGCKNATESNSAQPTSTPAG